MRRGTPAVPGRARGRNSGCGRGFALLCDRRIGRGRNNCPVPSRFPAPRKAEGKEEDDYDFRGSAPHWAIHSFHFFNFLKEAGGSTGITVIPAFVVPIYRDAPPLAFIESTGPPGIPPPASCAERCCPVTPVTARIPAPAVAVVPAGAWRVNDKTYKRAIPPPPPRASIRWRSVKESCPLKTTGPGG